MSGIVEQIRATMARRDGLSEEAMRPLAVAYATEVEQVNSRLSSAVALLHKGLRSEAIQQASMPPNVIDAAAALDFAEVEDWFDVLQFYGIPTPPPLRRDLADQLNESLIECQPLEATLRQHRRLAIARAPLSWRLKPLRRLVSLDPTNQAWLEDLESWEKTRHKQIAGEVAASVASKDGPALAALHRELAESEWHVAPESSLLERSRAALRQCVDRDGLAELETLAPKLHDAFCEFDEPTARRLASRWNEIVGALSTEIPRPLSESVDGALAWIAQLDLEAEQRRQRSRAISGLETALDRHGKLDELESLYHKATLFDEPLPDELLQRYQVAVEERRLARRRWFQVGIAGIAAASILILALLGVWQYRAARDARVREAEEELAGLVEANNLEAATTFWSNLQAQEPWIAQTPPLAALSAELDSLITEEEARVAEFRSYLEQAAADSPAAIDRAALAQAEKLAEKEQEKAQVFQLRQELERWQRQRRDEQTLGLAEELKVVRNQLDELEAGAGDEKTEMRLDGIVGRLQELLGEFPEANSSAKTQVNAVRTRAIELRSAIQSQLLKRRDELAALKRLRESGSLRAYTDNLELFVQRAPSSSLNSEFSLAFKEAPLWNAVDAWNAYLRAAEQAISERMSQTAMASYKSADQELSSSVSSSLLKLPEDLTEHLERYEERVEILDRVLGGLSKTVFSDLYTLVAEGGKGDRYFIYRSYFDENPTQFRPFGETVYERGLEVVVNDSGAVENRDIKGEYQILKEPFGTVRSLMDDNQVRLNSFLSDWEGEFLKRVHQLMVNEEIGAHVKELMIQHLLAGACEGSSWMASRLDELLLALRSSATSRGNWYDPVPFRPQLDAELHTRLVESLGRAYRSRPRLDRLSSSLGDRRLRWVGFLLRDDKGQLSVHICDQPGSDGQLVVLRASAEHANHAVGVSVGSFTDGSPVLDTDDSELIAGRPVFLYGVQDANE